MPSLVKSRIIDNTAEAQRAVKKGMQKSLGTIAAVYRGLDLLILCNMGHLFIFQVITFLLIYAPSVSNKTLCECQLSIPSHQTLYMKDTSSLLFSF